MSETRYYKVAGHLFSVTVDGNAGFFARCMDNYEPFAGPPECHPGQGAGGNVFSLSVLPPAPFDYTEEIRQEDEGQTIICGHRLAGESVFEFLLRDVSTGTLICSSGYREAC